MAASRAGRTGRQSLGRPGRHTVWVHSSVIALLLAGLAGCSGGTTPTGETPPASGTIPAADGTLAAGGTTPAAGPVTVTINQSRDQYSQHAVLVQLTNTTEAPITVTNVQLSSPLFPTGFGWPVNADPLLLPPHQAKSRPASLPTAACNGSPDGATLSAQPLEPVAVLSLVSTASAGPVTATDPFEVLVRNHAELCLAATAAAVATISFGADLDVAADGQTAVVRLLIDPQHSIKPQPVAESDATLTIESLGETTLLAQVAAHPWPTGLVVRPGEPGKDLPLTIRPARCDPHAVAEDKVGTLLPLSISVDGQTGVLKIAAGGVLRGKIYDFVTAACADG
ncbi:hypothetical protein [Arthrobacter ulcerisalmonis]|uniref:hypothetical protein n=1 Tax=Arthrobacter ulcerisalmonis TaxID=2483813 RepID=UPI001EF011C4|nr:hypothetical protein [Arthrobacter ulcerisalmonis]